MMHMNIILTGETCVLCGSPIEQGEKTLPVSHGPEEEPYGVVGDCCRNEFL